MLITVFISIYTTRLTLNILGAENFGLFGLIGGAIAMLGFFNSTMASATQRFISFAQGAREIEKLNRIFNMSILLHLGAAFFVLTIMEIAGYFFFNGILNIADNRMEVAKFIYQFMIISTLFSVISVPYEAVITSHENMYFYAILGIAESLLKLAIAYSITYSNFDHLMTYGFLMAVLPVFLLIFKQIYCHSIYPECKINIIRNYDTILLKQMTSFAAWSFLGSTSSLIANYGQGIVLNIFFGATINAAQGIANQLSGQLSVFSGNMLKALNPLIDKSEGAGNRAFMLKATMIGSKISFFLVMILYIPILIEMPYILEIWLKNIPDLTVIFCRLLLIRILIEHLFYPLVSAINAVGNIKYYQLTSSILLIFPLPVTYFLFQLEYPAYTIYLIFILYTLLASSIILYYAVKNCNLSFSEFLINVMIRCGCAFIITLIISCIPLYLMESGLIRCLFTALLSTTTYLFIVLFVGFSNEERHQLAQILSPLFAKFGMKKCSQ
ncbi:MAG: MATE family efflux transporter [Methylococcales bacterium]|nr:MATE family efflux transporter [Methylococcales bacterium]